MRVRVRVRMRVRVRVRVRVGARARAHVCVHGWFRADTSGCSCVRACRHVCVVFMCL